MHQRTKDISIHHLQAKVKVTELARQVCLYGPFSFSKGSLFTENASTWEPISASLAQIALIWCNRMCRVEDGRIKVDRH